MLKNRIEKIYEWLELSGFKAGDSSKISLSMDLIKEEFNELNEAVKNNDRKEILDAYVDIIWVMSNLTKALAITPEEIENMLLKVEESNYSKFCKTEEEAIETVKCYRLGVHWDKMGYFIDADYKYINGYYIVFRKEDGKILKSIEYKKV